MLEHEREHDSQWAAIRSIAAKIGCSSETLRRCLRLSVKLNGDWTKPLRGRR